MERGTTDTTVRQGRSACWSTGLAVMVLLAVASAGWAEELAIRSWDFDTDPGWTLEGEWQFGTPLGGGGTQYGYPDPTAGHTGTQVLGINLAGDYTVVAGPIYYATTGPINCTGESFVTVRFWQWMNAEALPYAYFGLEASNDGINWSVMWYNGYSEITSNQWQQVDCNITAVAANAPTVYLRWGYAFDPVARPMSGWNIDDVQIVARRPSNKPAYFRGLWTDAFKAGFKSISEIDDLVTRAVEGNYNAIIPELLAYHDDSGSGHGAYWASNIVPRAKDNGGIDSLGLLLQRAHAAGIEVHPWLLPYRVSKEWEPSGNTFLEAHPEYLMGPRESIGTRTMVGGAYVLDPGSPDVQEYLLSIVREIVTKYPVDGIHWDYIRYESRNAGYPSNPAYERSGLARFQRITGYTETPPATGEPLWDDFRRREVTELVRRVRAEIAALKIPGRPIVRFTAAVIPGYTYDNDFTQTTPYTYCYQDWAMWLQRGLLDAACPMLYDREHCSNEAYWYRASVDSSVIWRGNRHLFAGQATYLNSFENSSIQLNYARTADADGSVTYSYAGLRALETICDDNDGWGTDLSWFGYVSQGSFAGKKTTPPMPWRDPELATEGTLYGRVMDGATGQPIDDATVQVAGMDPVQTDGNGYYVVTLIPAVKSGTVHSVTASALAGARTHSVSVLAGDVRRNDFVLGPTQTPLIVEQSPPTSVCPGTDVTLIVVPQGEEISLLWRKDGTDLVDDGHYSGTGTDRLSISGAGIADVGQYTCVVTNSMGSIESTPIVFSLKTSTAIVGQPQAAGVQLHADAQFTLAAVGDGLKYRWRKNGVPLSNGGEFFGTNTSVLQVLNVTPADLGSYDCEVTGDCGVVVSAPVELSFGFAPGDFDADGDVDVTDFGTLQTCLTGPAIVVTDPACKKALLDDDMDIDRDDVTRFSNCLSGPGVAARLDCWK